MNPSVPLRVVRGACPHDCPDTCATLVTVDGDRVVSFDAEPDHPITQGWLCAKVRPYLERVNAKDRLMYPRRRSGKKGQGQWKRITWDEAIAEITDRWKSIIAEHGAAAILPYSFSGTLGMVNMTVSNHRLWNRMGASGLERSICGAAADFAVKSTLGAKMSPAAEDLMHSKLMIIWGHNPASTSPHFMPFLQDAMRNGMKLVVIDPRLTTTARRADLHLQPQPATDGALALGMIHVIFAEARHDERWLDAHALGWKDLRDQVATYTPERVAEITGIEAEAIIELAREWTSSGPAALKFADGLQRHENGGQTIRALLALSAVGGHIGKRGGGVYYSTGGYAKWNMEAVSHRSECVPTPRVINMNRLGAALTGEAADPPVMSLYVFGANPVAASPNSGKIVEGLLRDDLFTVVHEQFMTDTADYADILLPATTQVEQMDFHVPYGQRNLQFNDQAIPPMGECRSNWDVMRALAAGMGYTEPWLMEDTEAVIRGLIDASRPANPTLSGITFERLRDEGTVPYTLPTPDWVPFSDGVFPTPSGKVELRCDALAAIDQSPLPVYVEPSEFRDADPDMLTLLTGAAHHFVSTTFANQPTLIVKERDPFIEIHPEDAAARGIKDGDDVRVENARGWCVLRAVVTKDVRPGVVVSPKGRWASLSQNHRTVNWTVSDRVGDFAGQSTFHSNRVFVRPVSTGSITNRTETAVAD